MADEKTIQLVKLVKNNALSLYHSTLVGNPSPSAKGLYERLTHPKPGDLVVETSTAWMKHLDQFAGIGRLKEDTREKLYPTPEEALEHGWENYDECPTERIWYIELIFDDGRLFRWHNANFIVVLEEIWSLR